MRCQCVESAVLKAKLAILVSICVLGSAWSASQSSTPRAPLDEKAFTGNGTKCGSQGAGGKDCWPFHRYDEKALKKENPIFNKCCRPCMEKFSGDLSLLEIPNHVKRKVMKRFDIMKDSYE